MAGTDPANSNPANPANPAPNADPAANPNPPADPARGGETPPAPAPDKTVPYERFKEVNDKLKAREVADAAAETKRLADAGEHQKLAETYKAQAESAAGQLKQTRIENRVIVEANKLGIVDADAAVKLIDTSKVEVGDDGTVTGVEDALKALVEAKPYLTTKTPPTRVGTGASPAAPSNAGVQKFTASQISDPKFFRENEAAIMEAMKHPGAITEDRPGR